MCVALLASRSSSGISLVVKQQFSKLWSGVRFSHPAQRKGRTEEGSVSPGNDFFVFSAAELLGGLKEYRAGNFDRCFSTSNPTPKFGREADLLSDDEEGFVPALMYPGTPSWPAVLLIDRRTRTYPAIGKLPVSHPTLLSDDAEGIM